LAPLYTIGHSTRTLDELIATLRAHNIRTLVDIRAFPASRRLPQFNRELLETNLPAAGIRYVWMKALGGYRKKILEDSPHIALRNESFRNYADYMLTPEFERSLATERYSRDSRERENTPLQGTFSASQRKPGPRCAFEHSPKTARWTDARASTAHRLLTVIFDTAPDAAAFEFGASFRFDRRLFEDDVTGSIAWARAIAKAGVLPADEAAQIESALTTLLERGRSDPDFVSGADEDVHSFVERLLVEQLGDAGRRLHTGRSRNEQVSLDLRLYLRRRIPKLQRGVAGVIGALADQAGSAGDARRSTALTRATTSRGLNGLQM